jgi:hypothetical protein
LRAEERQQRADDQQQIDPPRRGEADDVAEQTEQAVGLKASGGEQQQDEQHQVDGDLQQPAGRRTRSERDRHRDVIGARHPITDPRYGRRLIAHASHPFRQQWRAGA